MTERKDEPGGHGEEREPTLPADEEAAWAEIVAGYGEPPQVPDAPPGTDDDRRGGDRDASGRKPDDGKPGDGKPGDGKPDDGRRDDGKPDDEPSGGEEEGRGAGLPVRSFTVYSAGTGPRDWEAPEDPEDDHFVPPEPPPLPEADTTTKFGWLGALGGPLLLLGAVLFGVHMSWWIITLGVGGFLCGFATLLTRLRDGDDDFDDPGGGAVV